MKEDKAFIQEQLLVNTATFIKFINEQTESSFTYSPDGKWSFGQILEHLNKSLAPVNLALTLPGFLFQILYGKPNRKARTNQELIDRYLQKLAAGGRASGRFIPRAVAWADKQKKLDAFKRETDKMINRLSRWSEDQLDQHLLPHPLLGKLTLREMLFFSAYHIKHHIELLQQRKV
jgi:hypothetical protein